MIKATNFFKNQKMLNKRIGYPKLSKNRIFYTYYT